MENHFSKEEKRRFRFKKHVKDHLFEYILDIIGPLLLTMLLLYICKAENYLYGIILSIAYSVGKILYNLHYYKKEHIDMDIKED